VLVKRSLSFLIVAILLGAIRAGAMPTHHWQFEGAGFQSDSIGSASLVAGGSPSQSAVPGSGSGSQFTVLSGNASAADLDIGDDFSTALTPTSDFTIEALVHLDNDPGIFGYAFAGFADGDTPSDVGWVLQTRQSSNPGPDNLVLATGLSGISSMFGMWALPSSSTYRAPGMCCAM
jgi:hypothetical protein